MHRFSTYLLCATIALFLAVAPIEARPPQKMSQQQKKNVQQLAKDLQEIHQASDVTNAMIQDLYNDLMAVYGTATSKPSPQSVRQLARDLSGAVDDSNLSESEIEKLCQDLVAVMTSAGIDEAAAEKLVKDLERILKASNVDADDIHKIVGDLQKIRQEAHKQHEKLPELPPEQKQNARKLVDDLKAIQEKSEVTDEMRQDLYEDLQAVYGTVHQPEPSTVRQFASDLAKALDDGRISPSEMNQLVEDLILVMTSAGITEEQAEEILKDIETILRASNVTPQDVQTIVNDLKAIYRTARANRR
ncbi:MAG: hypothetical protein D6795_00685 [Deltaproteobacteria bacterium]|nr:MAG: hypothetical protein D6795_00685 [Deltaproteobacteria bacterium]